jgi:hypothetical protein
MQVQKWGRQFHRWLSIVFTLTVALNFVVMIWGQPPMWVTFAPLPPLFILLGTGLYLFAVPYIARRRATSP